MTFSLDPGLGIKFESWEPITLCCHNAHIPYSQEGRHRYSNSENIHFSLMYFSDTTLTGGNPITHASELIRGPLGNQDLERNAYVEFAQPQSTSQVEATKHITTILASH